MTEHPVFISYARKTSKEPAEALHRELGGDKGLAFLDVSDIETLQKFPAEISDALLAAKVVVVFADETYFTRWYCLRELDLALTPFQKLARSGADSSARQAALSHIVVVLPDGGVESQVLNSLPADLRITNWPRASDTRKIAELVNERLAQVNQSIGQHLDAVMQAAEAEAARRRLSEQGAIPQPMSLRTLRLFPAAMEQSLGEGFKGRADDLWRLHHALWTMGVGTAALTGAIEAGGGFGKSRLATEYLHRYGPAYYQGGLFWIDAAAADDELKQEQAFHNGKKARDELTQALQQLPNEKPVLFVIDNVPESMPNAQPQPLSAWCPALGHVTVLATSRMRVDLGGGNVQELNIDVLDPEASVALLTYGVKQVSALKPEQWLTIAEWVGRLPLALDQLQRAMKAGALAPSELYSMTSDSRPPTAELDRLAKAISPQLPAGAVRGVTEALNVSYERLPEEASTAARLIAQLAPEPIPLALLKALGNQADQPSVRAALVARSFVTPVEPLGSAERKVEFLGRMHRVLADFLRAKSPDGMGELLRAGKAVNQVMGPDACRDPGRWALMNACVPHAEQAFRRLADGRGQQEGEAAVECGLYLGILYGEQGAAGKAREVSEATLRLASRVLGPEHRTTLASMNNLAGTLYALGDFDGARRLYQQVFDINERIFGYDHPDTLASTSNLATALWALGDLAGARELEERALGVRKRTLGFEDPTTLTSMNNLAETLRALGDLEGARKLHQEAFDIRKRILGPDHPNTLGSKNNLAGALKELGDLEGARVLQGQVVDSCKHVLGSEHPLTLTSINNLAGTLRALGDVQGARKLHQEELDICKRVLGPDHPDTSVSAWNVLSVLDQLGETASAEVIVNEFLAWLLTRDSESLGAAQRKIHDLMVQRGK